MKLQRNWTVTSPTVQLNDGSTLTAFPGSSSTTLTIHTNNLNLGDGSNGGNTNIGGNGVTIDDNGGAVFSTIGLTIAAANGNHEYINANSGALQINATTSPLSTLLLTSSTPGTGAWLYLDGTSVAVTASKQLIIDQNMSLENSAVTAGWTLTADSVLMRDGSEISLNNTANVTFNVSPYGMSQVYPQDFDLR